jgi:hypothetical protein
MFLTSLPNSFKPTHPYSLCISCIYFSYAISLCRHWLSFILDFPSYSPQGCHIHPR